MDSWPLSNDSSLPRTGASDSGKDAKPELHPEVQQRERTDTDRLRAGGERDHVRSGGARTGSSSTGSAIILYGLFHHSAKTRCQHCYSFGGDLDEAIGRGDHASRCSVGAAPRRHVSGGSAAQGRCRSGALLSRKTSPTGNYNRRDEWIGAGG